MNILTRGDGCGRSCLYYVVNLNEMMEDGTLVRGPLPSLVVYTAIYILCENGLILKNVHGLKFERLPEDGVKRLFDSLPKHRSDRRGNFFAI